MDIDYLGFCEVEGSPILTLLHDEKETKDLHSLIYRDIYKILYFDYILSIDT